MNKFQSETFFVFEAQIYCMSGKQLIATLCPINFYKIMLGGALQTRLLIGPASSIKVQVRNSVAWSSSL